MLTFTVVPDAPGGAAFGYALSGSYGVTDVNGISGSC